jgi:hypothetical protein
VPSLSREIRIGMTCQEENAQTTSGWSKTRFEFKSIPAENGAASSQSARNAIMSDDYCRSKHIEWRYAQHMDSKHQNVTHFSLFRKCLAVAVNLHPGHRVFNASPVI